MVIFMTVGGKFNDFNLGNWHACYDANLENGMEIKLSVR
jgi:hypothetical protein